MKQTIKENIRRNGTNIRVIAGLLAAVLGLTGCGEQKEPSVKILPSSTISGTLDAVSNLTKMDELLSADKFVNKSDGKEYTFEELLNLYNEARKEEDLSACNTLLYKIGRMIMKAQLAEALNIKPEQIVSLSIDGTILEGYVRTTTITYKTKYTEIVSGGIEIEGEKTITRELITDGELDDLAINISRACNHSLEFGYDGYMDLDIDNVYESFVEHILTTPSIQKNDGGWFGTDYYVANAELSEEKVDAFNAYNNGPKASSSKYGYNYNGKDRGISLCEAIRLQKQEQSKNMAAKAMGSYNAKRHTR